MLRRTLLLSAAVILGLILLLSVMTPSQTPTRADSSAGWSASGNSPSSGGPHLTQVSSVTPCGVFDAVYGNDSWIPYYQNYSAIFSKICTTPQFVTIYNETIAVSPNSSFVIGSSFSRNETNLGFTIYATELCSNASFGLGTGATECVFQADWFGYLSNNSFSGPVIHEYPAAYAGGPTTSPGSSPVKFTPLLVEIIGAAAAATAIGLTVVLVRSRNLPYLEDRNRETGPTASSGSQDESIFEEKVDNLDDIF